MDISKIVKDAKAKVADIDKDEIVDRIKAIDMGVAYTKMQDVLAKVNIEDKKQAIIDFADSPEMEKIKGVGRTVKDFMGFVPNYVQSVPGMIKDAVEKIKK